VVVVETLAKLGVTVGVTPAAWDLTVPIKPTVITTKLIPITVLAKIKREVFSQLAKFLNTDLLIYVLYIGILFFCVCDVFLEKKYKPTK
jgi:hypothetical protein